MTDNPRSFQHIRLIDAIANNDDGLFRDLINRNNVETYLEHIVRYGRVDLIRYVNDHIASIWLILKNDLDKVYHLVTLAIDYNKLLMLKWLITYFGKTCTADEIRTKTYVMNSIKRILSSTNEARNEMREYLQEFVKTDVQPQQITADDVFMWGIQNDNHAICNAVSVSDDIVWQEIIKSVEKRDVKTINWLLTKVGDSDTTTDLRNKLLKYISSSSCIWNSSLFEGLPRSAIVANNFEIVEKTCITGRITCLKWMVEKYGLTALEMLNCSVLENAHADIMSYMVSKFNIYSKYYV